MSARLQLRADVFDRLPPHARRLARFVEDREIVPGMVAYTVRWVEGRRSGQYGTPQIYVQAMEMKSRNAPDSFLHDLNDLAFSFEVLDADRSKEG